MYRQGRFFTRNKRVERVHENEHMFATCCTRICERRLNLMLQIFYMINNQSTLGGFGNIGVCHQNVIIFYFFNTWWWDLFVSIFVNLPWYIFKERTYLLGMSRYFKSEQTRVSRRKHSRELRSNGCESMSRIVMYTRIHAWPKPWHGSRGRSVPKFGNSIHSCVVTRPHNRGWRQTEIPAESAIIFFSESLRPGINAVVKPVVSLDKTAITPS